MNRRFMRYIFVGMVSASLVAPAHAVDLRSWFSSLSTTSKNTFYAATAAVIAGLTVLAWKMCSKSGKAHAEEARHERIAQAENHLAKLRMDHEIQRKEKQRKVAQAKSDLAEIKAKQAELRANIDTDLKNGLAAMQADIQTLLHKTQKEAIYEQRKLVAKFTDKVISSNKVVPVLCALKEENYSLLSGELRFLLKSWPKAMRQQALERLERHDEHIKKKKAAQRNGHVQQVPAAVSPTMVADRIVDRKDESKREAEDFSKHFGLQS